MNWILRKLNEISEFLTVVRRGIELVGEEERRKLEHYEAQLELERWKAEQVAKLEDEA